MKVVVLFVSVALGTMVQITEAVAATYRVDATGTIESVQSGLVGTPFSTNDSVRLSFIYKTSADRTSDRFPSSPGTTIEHHNVVSGLRVDWGGYQFTQDPDPSVFDISSFNKILVQDDFLIGPNVRDGLLLSQTVVGDDIGAAEAVDFFIFMNNVGGMMLDSTELSGSLFTNETLVEANERSDLVLRFVLNGSGIASVASIDTISTTLIAPVPLPAGGVLLATAFGLLGFSKWRQL